MQLSTRIAHAQAYEQWSPLTIEYARPLQVEKSKEGFLVVMIGGYVVEFDSNMEYKGNLALPPNCYATNVLSDGTVIAVQDLKGTLYVAGGDGEWKSIGKRLPKPVRTQSGRIAVMNDDGVYLITGSDSGFDLIDRGKHLTSPDSIGAFAIVGDTMVTVNRFTGVVQSTHLTEERVISTAQIDFAEETDIRSFVLADGTIAMVYQDVTDAHLCRIIHPGTLRRLELNPLLIQGQWALIDMVSQITDPTSHGLYFTVFSIAGEMLGVYRLSGSQSFDTVGELSLLKGLMIQKQNGYWYGVGDKNRRIRLGDAGAPASLSIATDRLYDGPLGTARNGRPFIVGHPKDSAHTVPVFTYGAQDIELINLRTDDVMTKPLGLLQFDNDSRSFLTYSAVWHNDALNAEWVKTIQFDSNLEAPTLVVLPGNDCLILHKKSEILYGKKNGIEWTTVHLDSVRFRLVDGVGSERWIYIADSHRIHRVRRNPATPDLEHHFINAYFDNSCKLTSCTDTSVSIVRVKREENRIGAAISEIVWYMWNASTNTIDSTLIPLNSRYPNNVGFVQLKALGDTAILWIEKNSRLVVLIGDSLALDTVLTDLRDLYSDKLWISNSVYTSAGQLWLCSQGYNFCFSIPVRSFLSRNHPSSSGTDDQLIPASNNCLSAEPNPIQDHVTISLMCNTGVHQCQVSVYDVTGRCMITSFTDEPSKNEMGAYRFRIRSGEWSRGYYYVVAPNCGVVGLSIVKY